MTIFTYSQARQNFASVLDIASREGSVKIRRKDGRIFSLSPEEPSKKSPLDIRGVNTKATTTDILFAIRESRNR